MMHDDMMVGAFSHSTAVGKLRQELPDVPLGARVMLPRYTLDEAATVCHYYLRYADKCRMVPTPSSKYIFFLDFSHRSFKSQTRIAC